MGRGELAEEFAKGLWTDSRVGLTTTARVVGEAAGRQRVPRVARGIGGPEVTSSILFREFRFPGIPFQACPYLPGSTIICLT